ncbi:MAG: ABC transporter permease [Thermoproteota archaeon]|nr:ABC transporter permease [Thermoproteota archaeon]
MVISNLNLIKHLVRSPAGLTGIVILIFLLSLTIYGLLFVPITAYSQWNNPNYWIDYPKTAAPSWTNIGFGPKLFEHLILNANVANITTNYIEGIRTISHRYSINIQSDSFPNDFMFTYSVKYDEIPPVILIDVLRPDGEKFDLYYSALPASQGISNTYSGRIFSTDRIIEQNLAQYKTLIDRNVNVIYPQTMLFSELNKQELLKGVYHISMTFFLFDNTSTIDKSGVILGGKTFGLMGTDDLRRDLAIGIILGSPVALFIGLTVSTISVTMGLIYGVISGYRGKKTDETMMRVNDIFYALPALPLLIILSITFGRSIFLIAGFLIIFGWVGTAKIIRSLALQIKTFQYVEAAKFMGQSDLRIIFKHIIPQLLPLTYASMAIAVPSAILGEAALSFLGLGDPSIPTWGQILHEANSADAAARGIWWWILPPGLMIAITGLAFYLIGNTLDSLANPLKNSFRRV